MNAYASSDAVRQFRNRHGAPVSKLLGSEKAGSCRTPSHPRRLGLEDRSSWRGLDWSWWESGQLVNYCEAFPDARDFAVIVGRVRYWARDLYCVNAQCKCRDVLLNVLDVSAEPVKSVGTIEVNYDHWQVKVTPESVSADTLREVWRELDDEKNLRDEVRRRHEELKEIGEEITKLARVPKEMSIEKILAALTFYDNSLPRAAIEQAVQRRLEITPRLIEIIEDTIARAAELSEDSDYFAHIYALFLLAQFREQGAYAPMVRLASLPKEVLGPGRVSEHVRSPPPRAPRHVDVAAGWGFIFRERGSRDHSQRRQRHPSRSPRRRGRRTPGPGPCHRHCRRRGEKGENPAQL